MPSAPWKRLTHLAVFAIPFAAAWTFAPRVTLEQFELPKHAALLLCVAVMLAGHGTGRLTGVLRASPPLALLLLAVGLSACAAAAPFPAWLGDHENISGVLTWSLYVVLFTAGNGLIAGARKRFATAVVLAAAGSAGYGLAQQAGWDPFRGELFRHVRAMAGNPDFLAQQLAMALPFVLLPMLLKRKLWHLGLLGILLVVLALTGSRAGLAAGLVASGWLIVRLRRVLSHSRPPFRLLAGTAVVALIGAELLIAPEISLRTRLAALGNGGGLYSSRGALWHGAAIVAVNRPLFGWGPDQLGSIFLSYAPSGWASREGLGETARNAHCEPLHLAATLGALGLGAWLWLLVGTWRRWRSRPPDSLDAAAAAAVGAYLLHNLFSFGTAATSPIFWVLLGWLNRPQQRAEPPPAPSTGSPIRLMVAIVLGTYGAVRLTADGYGYRGNEAERAGRRDLAAPAFRAAVTLAPWESTFVIRLAWVLESLGRPVDALPLFERAAAMKPLDGIVLGHVGRLRFALAAAAQDLGEQRAALALLVRAIDLAGSQPSLYGPALNAAQSLGDLALRDRLLAQLAQRDPEWYTKMTSGGQ